MLDDKTLALLGDREAAERLTAAGLLLPCWRCGGQARIDDWVCGYENGTTIECTACHAVVCEGVEGGDGWHERAVKAWNTRAPVLTPNQLALLKIGAEPRKFEEGENNDQR